MRRQITAVSCFFTLYLSVGTCVADEIRIGVLAYRGAMAAVDRWQPTADYLSEKIPQHHFQVIPFGLEQLRVAAAQASIDFIITNTGEYVDLEVHFGISRIATLQYKVDDKLETSFGAVIFVRADRTDINTLADLKGKSFMGVKETGFGGFRMAWRELLEHGIEPYKDFSALTFSGFPQGAVATAVKNGNVDAGTFRTGSLERMAKQGKINLQDFRVLNQKPVRNFPLQISTRLYPTWPFAKLKHVSFELAESVASELFKLSSKSKAANAALLNGWTIPLNYQPVHELLMILKVGPYAGLDNVSFMMLVERYWVWMAIILGLFSAMTVLTLSLIKEIRIRKRVEHELNQHQEHLLELVHERTHDIVRMRDQAVSASEVKSVFLSTMSHELRTPLNAIIGYGELLLEDDRFSNNQLGARELQKIHVSALHLLRIIDKILSISRIEDGSARLKVEIFSLIELVEDVVNAIRPLAVEHNNILEVINECPYETVQSDLYRLQEAIIQILENAVKFTDHGKIVFTIKAETINNFDWVVFIVSDNGIGMSPDQQVNIFDVFTQADNKFTRKFDGIGVGLAICRSYCRIMGGDISFSSQKGKGSQFTIRVPTVISKTIHRLGVA